jgi:hypothetical protein
MDKHSCFLVKDFRFAVRSCFEIALVKVVYPNIAILASGCICGTRRVHCDSKIQNMPNIIGVGLRLGMRMNDVRVERTKVAFDPTYFLFEDAMPEARFEFTLS